MYTQEQQYPHMKKKEELGGDTLKLSSLLRFSPDGTEENTAGYPRPFARHSESHSSRATAEYDFERPRQREGSGSIASSYDSSDASQGHHVAATVTKAESSDGSFLRSDSGRGGGATTRQRLAPRPAAPVSPHQGDFLSIRNATIPLAPIGEVPSGLAQHQSSPGGKASPTPPQAPQQLALGGGPAALSSPVRIQRLSGGGTGRLTTPTPKDKGHKFM